MFDEKRWITLNIFPESVSYIRGILETSDDFYVIGSKGISTLNNEVYKFQSNNEYDYWCTTCRVGNNILVVWKEKCNDDDVESRLVDPINCKWSDFDIRTKRRYFSVVYYLNKIFIVGGFDDAVLNSIEVYDPISKTQVLSPIKMNEARCDHKVIAYKKKLFVFGGYDKDGHLSSVEMFSPETNKFVMMAPMKTVRSSFGCCRVGNLVYVIGGAIGFANRTKSVEIYNMDSNTWTDGVDIPVAKCDLHACAVNNKLK